MSYWEDRLAKEQEVITNKTQAEINKQLNKYYASCMRQVIADFEATYNKLIATVGSGNPVTVADLYKLDKYWQMQVQLKHLCQKLGDQEIALLGEKFEQQWQAIYESISLPTDAGFSQVSTSSAEMATQTLWVADGQDFSKRVWNHTNELVLTLNEQLIHCIVTGKSDKQLRDLLMERFQVTRNRANTLIRSETARIQTASAAKRYEDAGLKKYMIMGREEHDHCGNKAVDCREMDGKTFYYSEMKVGKNAPPFHPNCRCRIKPVIENDILQQRAEENRAKEQAKRAQKMEAERLKNEAKALRERARALKSQGETDAAKELEARARELEKKYKELYASL